MHCPDTGAYTTFGLNVSPQIGRTKEGKAAYISSKGHMTFPVNSIDDITNHTNDKVRQMYPTTTDGIVWRELKHGEKALYEFIQTLIRFQKDDKKAAWLNDMQTNKLDIETIYNGDFSGLKGLVNYTGSKGNRIVMMYEVTEKITESGDKKYYQAICRASDTIHRIANGKDLSEDYIASKIEAAHTRQVNSGYKLTNKLFTSRFQEFKMADCYNAEVTTSTTAAPLSWGD
jgi:hypothetical protein